MATLLPGSSGLFENAFEEALVERWSVLEAGADAIKGIKFNPPPSFLPFLVYEYGLGELTPYLPNLYNLIDEGIAWQRVRGTLAAVSKGLGWLGYTATLENAWHGRTWWNSYQLRFPSLPLTDDPDLERIEGISGLSVPKRSQLRRGVYQYDVGALEAGHSRLDDTMLERESGVAVTPAGTLWSFGRATEFEHTLSEAEGTALGNWIEPPEEDGLPWVEMTYPWVTAEFKWADSPANQRRALMAEWFAVRTLFLRLIDGEGGTIGYRRCRAVRPVTLKFQGPYAAAGQTWGPLAGSLQVYIEAMTDFGDADGVTAEGVELIAGGVLAEGLPAGRLWLQPGELQDGTAFAFKPVSIPLRTTVREQFKFLLRF